MPADRSMEMADAAPRPIPPAWNFSGFDQTVLKVFDAARDEARNYKHHMIFTEHILLGLASASDVVTLAGVDSAKLRNEIQARMKPGQNELAKERLQFGPQAKHALSLAFEEAHEAQAQVVVPQHLLLALLQDEKGSCKEVLKVLGLELDEYRRKLA